MDKYIVKGDAVWERYSDDLFQGYTVMNPPVRKGEPWICYVGAKISLEEWRKVLAFFKWSYEDFKGESQVRLYFNKELGKWRAWAFPQEKDAGLSTREIPEKEGEERQKAGLGKGWILGGTVHHHCASLAYQSGTDKDNESTQSGVHITVGNMDKFEYSLHGRVTFRGTFYEIDWADWFEMPPKLEGLPESFRIKVMEYFLSRGVTDEDVFPSEWKDNVIKKHSSVYYPPGRKTETSPNQWHPSGKGWEYQGPARDNGSESDQTAGSSPNKHFGDDKPPKPLTKKERQLFKKLLNRVGPGDLAEADLLKLVGDSEEHSAKLHRAAIATVQMCNAYAMDTYELFACALRIPGDLDPLQLEAVEKLHEIMEKEGVFPVELQDWIKEVTLEEVPEGGEVPRT